MYLMCPLQASEQKGLQYLQGHPDFCLEYADIGPFTPTHPLAARIVTIHNDHHTGNMLDLCNQKGLRVIDLETASVDYAIGDIMSGPAC